MEYYVSLSTGWEGMDSIGTFIQTLRRECYLTNIWGVILINLREGDIIYQKIKKGNFLKKLGGKFHISFLYWKINKYEIRGNFLTNQEK